jgi:NAD-dependent DNA ligase
MTDEQIKRLKDEANHFYLDVDNGSEMQDIEYDRLAALYEHETGNSVKTLVDWDSDLKLIHEPCDPLDKIQVTDNDLRKAVESYLDQFNITKDYILNYKYDGSSIKAYYENGRLKSILGTPDEEYGILRTKGFWNMFPHEVPVDIKSIQGEVLVDASVYGELARNKANGITNSKYKDDEIESEAFIRVYKINYHDGDWSLERQLNTFESIKPIIRDRLRLDPGSGELALFSDVIFCVAQDLSTKDSPKNSIITETLVIEGKSYSVDFQVDGVVAYTFAGIKGFKFYYTESAVTKVEGVQWNRKANGSFAPVLVIETIELNGKYIGRVSAGGVPNLIGNKMGKGSKVRVILANMTIPKVIEVIESSEDYQFPKCGCGYQLSEKDTYGATLKCQNEEECSWKVTNWYREFIKEIIDYPDCINVPKDKFFENELWWILSYLKIDRWSPEDKYLNKIDQVEFANTLFNLIEANDFDTFFNLIESNFYFTDLNLCNLNINAASTFSMLKLFIKDYDNVSQDYYEKLFEND